MYFLVDFKSKNIFAKIRSQFFGYLSAEISRVYQCVSLCILQLCKISKSLIAKKNNSDFAIKVFEFSCKNYFNPSIFACILVWKYVRQVCMFLTVAKPFLWSFCIILNCTVSWTNWIVAFFLWWDSIPFFLFFSTRHQIDLPFLMLVKIQYQKPFWNWICYKFIGNDLDLENHKRSIHF